MSSSAYRPLDPEGLETNETTIKLLYAGTGSTGDASLGPGQSYILIKEDVLALVANQDNAISVSQDVGVTLTGPISLSAMPDQITIGGGYWKINPLVLSGLPSTTATPIPWVIPTTPKLTKGSTELFSAISLLTSFSNIGS